MSPLFTHLEQVSWCHSEHKVKKKVGKGCLPSECGHHTWTVSEHPSCPSLWLASPTTAPLSSNFPSTLRSVLFSAKVLCLKATGFFFFFWHYKLNFHEKWKASFDGKQVISPSSDAWLLCHLLVDVGNVYNCCAFSLGFPSHFHCLVERQISFFFLIASQKY